MEIRLNQDEKDYKHGPDDRIKLPWMHRFVHVMPPAEFLFSAVYSERSTVDSRDSDHNIALGEDVVRRKIVDYRREKYKSPKVYKHTPEFETTYSFGKIEEIFHGLNDTIRKKSLIQKIKNRSDETAVKNYLSRSSSSIAL
jgi:hypothetical protein